MSEPLLTWEERDFFFDAVEEVMESYSQNDMEDEFLKMDNIIVKIQKILDKYMDEKDDKEKNSKGN